MADNTFKQPLNIPWLIKMAWRDSRRNRSRLFLFVSSIILGIAALVAIYSFEHNLRNDIDKQAMSLIGADLMISSNRAVSPEAQKLLDSLGGEQSQERTFVSMIYFPQTQGTRLVQIRALQGGFPFYGSLETTPAEAGINFRKEQSALVDKTLMMQFNAKVGDSVKIGELFFKIAGILNNAPGQTGISSSVAPAVYIPLDYLAQTGLSQKGSRINYNFYYKYKSGTDVEAMLKKIDPQLEKESLNSDTVQSRKENTGRSFADLTGFLALVGFIALLLGCIGVASAIHIYIREKLGAIALLRCLGVQASQAFLIYLIQIVGVGLVGSIAGAALGALIQQLLPAVLQDFLPIQISMDISWAAIGQGIILGVIISLLFAMLPLVSVRDISPLNTLRLSFEETGFFRDRLKWLIYFLILLFIFVFTWVNIGGFMKSIYFTGGVLAAFIILTGAAWLLMWAARKYFPASWSYLWRQGFANLFRPNNQTLILIVSIGLGSAFISTLFLVQDILISRVTLSTSNNQPNMVLFDIQSSQKEKVAELTRSYHLPVIQEVPIITMNLEEINGKTYAEAEKDTSSGAARGGFNREIRATYRDTLTASEKITEGRWSGKAEDGKPIFVSLETGYAERMKLKIGDSLVFNVQGVLTSVQIGSFRRVDWGRVQTNFRVVFPSGVLEEAPQFHVLITRVPSNEVSARFQQAVVSNYPNISIFDLGLILSVLDEILDKIGFVIRFMGGFSIITGLIVLIASVLISKYQRMQESVLLRTMGASRRQILIITALEYFFLGALASLTGIILSFAGSWALAVFNFETEFHPPVWPAVIIFLSISLLTVVIGLFNSRGVLNRPPLEVLRREV